MTTGTAKVRENKARRMLTRQGYRLHKVRRYDPLARDFGRYFITDPRGRRVADLPDLDAVEGWAKGER